MTTKRSVLHFNPAPGLTIFLFNPTAANPDITPQWRVVLNPSSEGCGLRPPAFSSSMYVTLEVNYPLEVYMIPNREFRPEGSYAAFEGNGPFTSRYNVLHYEHFLALLANARPVLGSEKAVYRRLLDALPATHADLLQTLAKSTGAFRDLEQELAELAARAAGLTREFDDPRS